MSIPPFHSPILSETTTERIDSVELRSGPGAPMFEQNGTQTRIRRAPVRAIASFSWQDGPRQSYGQICNLSPGGCLLKTESTIITGTIIEMSVVLVGEGKRRIKAELRGIVRRRTWESNRNAYGVEFLSETREEREALQWLYSQAMI